MITPKVVAIYICPEAGQSMQMVGKARVIKDCGIEGDRYATGQGAWNRGSQGKRQISLISIEGIQQANKGLARIFLPIETRRNILTEGIDLSTLIGQEFSIGEVLMM